VKPLGVGMEKPKLQTEAIGKKHLRIGVYYANRSKITAEESSENLKNLKSIKTNKLGIQEFPFWNHDSIVRDTLSFYADSGDIQTCATICLGNILI